MDFSIKAPAQTGALQSAQTDCLAVGVLENDKLPPATKALDQTGEIAAALRSGDISGRPGSTLLLRQPKGFAAKRLLLVGLGKDESVSEQNFKLATVALANAFSTLGAKDAIVALPLTGTGQRDLGWAIRQCVFAVYDQAYRSDSQKSRKEPESGGVRKIALAVASADAASARMELAQAVAMARGVALAKDLGNLSGNVCTPTYLAATARKLAKSHRLGVEILQRKQIEALKMGSFLSVAKGSDEPPRFIVLTYQGGKAKEAPVVLVGKGLTFDAGGISLKPGAGMDEMKYDMCGAAS
ncbi:MAG: M17 family peptidase N-terminal domain-containing protein, partial [Burkholderiaceae bacterium]|nr:M17 family peptidase N-terminal domain-containing protein [Burkholderiaceae bacterium]